MLEGARAGTAEVLEEGDRRAAIATALDLARPGDIVVVAGKGHETGQEVDGVVHPFDDREVVRELLALRPARLSRQPSTAGRVGLRSGVRNHGPAVRVHTEGEAMRAILLSGALSLLVSLLGSRVAINQFRRLGLGQQIRDDGPTSHHTKLGTPTMGGVVVILATLVGYFVAKLATMSAPTGSALLLLFLFVGHGRWSASSTTTSRSPGSAASACGARPR